MKRRMMTLPALTTRAGILPFSLLSAALLGGAAMVPLWSGTKPVTAVVSVPAEEVVRGAVQELTSVNFIPTVRSEGTVAACDEVNLTAQLAGQVLSVSPVFEEGAFLSAGTVIAELDAADFRGAVLAAEAQLARARSAFALEETRARQAKLNWEELGYRDAPGELVLRVPQLNEARASVDAAEAQLARARRDMERTNIRAPFDCRVRTRQLVAGQSVSATTVVGAVFSASHAQVRLPIPLDEAGALALPETSAQPPLPVEFQDEQGNLLPPARIVRTSPVVDSEKGTLFATALIDAPFAVTPQRASLRIGQKITALIRGTGLNNVYALPREAVGPDDQVNLVSRSSARLCRRPVKPLWADEEQVIVRDLPADWLLGISPEFTEAPEGTLVEIADGAPLLSSTAGQ
jgi:RND family efflux transporter MFP subunit